MPIDKYNTRGFHNRLYGGMKLLSKIVVHKREDDQRQGQIRVLELYQCWRSSISKSGQTIRNDMASDHETTWHIPITEMQRVGINYFNALDIIIDSQGRYWQPESMDRIDQKLFGTHWTFRCRRVDPVNNRVVMEK